MVFLSTLTSGQVSEVTEKSSGLDFLRGIGDKLSSFVSDIARLMDALPDWLESLIVVAVSVLLVILALRLVAFVLDSIPFL